MPHAMLSRISRPAVIGVVSAAAAVAGCAQYSVLRDANIQPVSAVGMPAQAPAPTLRVGDQWSYTRRETMTGLVSNQARGRVTGVTGEGYQIAEEWQSGGPVSALYDFNLNPLRIGNVDFRPPFQRFSFPLAVGKTWQSELVKREMPVQRYSTVRESVKGAVIGWERITVPAGTFTALRIDVTTVWSDIDASGARGSSRETVWYVPEVRNVALLHRQDFYGDVRIINDSVLELTAFSVGN
ncbi:MAG: hypothetical protein ACREVS_09475 [Burkholderiales bacterium]